LPGAVKKAPAKPEIPNQARNLTGQQGPGTPAAPPGAARRQKAAPNNPFAPGEVPPGVPGGLNPGQGAPPSPVLRSPTRSAPRLPQQGTGPDLPPGLPGRTAPGATSPVLGGRRPQQGTPSYATPPTAPRPEVPGFATPPTTAPVLRGQGGGPGGPGAGQPEPPPANSSTLRNRAQAGAAHKEEVASRRRKQAEVEAARLERQFEMVKEFLAAAEEKAWTVETPGGAVFDAAPARQHVPQTEPRPTLGGAA
jgi:hypothetical protein